MRRLRGVLWLSAGLVVSLLAGIVGFVTLSRAAAQGAGEGLSRPTTRVVVAAQAISVRARLTAEDVQIKEVPVDAVPEGALTDAAEAEGKLTLVDLYPGEILLAQRLLDPNLVSADGRLALYTSEDEVLMAYPATDLISQVGLLKPGDHVDLLISLEIPVDREQASGVSQAAGQPGVNQNQDETEQATFVVLQNVGIAAIVDGNAAKGENNKNTRTGQAILFTLKPQDALVLKYLKDAEGIQDIVLRAPGVDQPFPADPIDIDYVIDRYQIPVGKGR